MKKKSLNIISENKIINSFNILIAEDDEISMFYLKKLFKEEKAKLFLAYNGLETVELIKKKHEIDIVLMDLKMPIMDGFEATKQIKKLRPLLPIIAQTAFTFPEDIERAIESGCDDYIIKPLKRDLLLSKIIHLLYIKK